MMDFIKCEVGTAFWYIRTDEELETMKARDVEAGRGLDDAGETRIYSKVCRDTFHEPTLLAVTKKRNVAWPHWTRKPTHLVEGLATVDGVPRIVMVKVG